MMMMMMMAENLEHLQRTVARSVTSNKINDAPAQLAEALF
jgi:hypothetical protein